MEKVNNEELVRRFQGGDRDCLLVLWNVNQGLVRSVISCFRDSFELDDLMQEAFLGLSSAAERYDEETGCPFASYMAKEIRWEILRYAEESGTPVRLPRHLWDKIRKMNKTRDALREALGRDPEDEELARELGLSVDKLRLLMIAKDRQRSASMDAPLSQDDSEGGCLGDTIADPENNRSEERRVGKECYS